MARIEAAGARPETVLLALDRREHGQGDRSAVDEVGERHGVRATAFVNIDDLIAFLAEQPDMADALAAMRAYRARYGVA